MKKIVKRSPYYDESQFIEELTESVAKKMGEGKQPARDIAKVIVAELRKKYDPKQLLTEDQFLNKMMRKVGGGQRVEDHIALTFDHISAILQQVEENINKITIAAPQKEKIISELQKIIAVLEINKQDLQQGVYVQNRKLEEMYEELELAHKDLKSAYEKLEIAHERDRLAILGEAAARLVHEIKNPLSVIEGFVQLLPKKYDQPGFREKFIETLSREIERLSRITKQLLSFAKPVELRLESITLEILLNEIFPIFEKRFKDRNIQIIKKMASLIPFSADKDLLKQVFVNIIDNAMSAMDEKGGTLTVSSKKEDHFLRIEIENTGPLIPPDKIDKIFNPFFTTKSQGTGLGLSICKNIVEKHGGIIFVENVSDKGVKLIIKLPIQENKG